jgi:capsular polysaccharide biosynthesis protein
MVKSFFNKSPDQVNIFDLLIICWKDRILIITVLIVSIVVGLIVSFFSYKKEMQQILFEIRYPVNAIFKFKDVTLEKYEIEKEKLEFISIFESNLNSLNNLDSFVEQSKDLDSFKNFLSKNKISSKEYFRTFRISSFADKYGKKVAYANLLSKYVFTYPAELIEGDKFLTNYIEYTKKKTLEEYSLSIKFAAQQECENIEKIFDSITNAEFFKFEKINDEFATTFINYSNCKTLSKNFDKFIFQINNYNFLNENVSVGTIVPSVPRYFYLVLSLLFGFFISIVIIFFKKNFKDR